MPPPKPDLVTKEGLELRLVPITQATNDVTGAVFGDPKTHKVGLIERLERVEVVLDKYKFTLAALTIIANSIITLSLAALEIYKAVHGIP